MFKKKIPLFLSKSIDNGITILCILFTLIGGYALIDAYNVYHAANDRSILRYKPAKGETWDPSGDIDGAVAWLEIDDTSIDYPIMQGEDNSQYLNTDPYGNFSLAGSIFLDFRNAPDFSDEYSLMYGHHMENGYMFGCLDYFRDKAFFDTYRYGTLTIAGKEYKITLFAEMQADALDDAVFVPGEKEDVLKYTEEHAEIYYPPEDENIIALSTCTDPLSTSRTIVLGYTEK